MKIFHLNRFTIISFCSIILIIISFLFLLQTFVTNTLNLGETILTFNGYETIFGATKTYRIISPLSVDQETKFLGHPLSIIGFFFLCIGSILQVGQIITKISKKFSNKFLAIINLISAIFIILSGIITFFTVELFKIANSSIGQMEFYGVGVITSSICILICGLVTILNSVELIPDSSNRF